MLICFFNAIARCWLHEYFVLGRARNELIDDEAACDDEEEEDDVDDEGMYSLLEY